MCKATWTRCQQDPTSPSSCLRCWRSHFWEAGSSSNQTDHLDSFFPGQREITHIYDCFAAAPPEWMYHQQKYNYIFRLAPLPCSTLLKNCLLFLTSEVLKTIQPQQRIRVSEIRNIFQYHKGREMINQLIFVMHLDMWWFVCSETVR